MTRRALLARTAAFFLALPLVSRLKPAKAAPVYVEPKKTLCRMIDGPYDGQEMLISETSTQFVFPIAPEVRLAWVDEGFDLPAIPRFRAGVYDRADATNFAFRDPSWPEWAEVKRRSDEMIGLMTRDEARKVCPDTFSSWPSS